jgi:vacuolar protein sorting-associated protein 35
MALDYYRHQEEDAMWEKKCTKLFSLARQAALTVASSEAPSLALRLFLQSALAVNQTRFEKTEALAYEFFTQVG